MSRSNIGALALALLALTGCELRQAMYNTGRIKPLEKNDFFADGRASRPLVEGTIPRGHLQADDAYFKGTTGEGIEVSEIPVTVTAALLARGKGRFDIYCAVCHGQAGFGDGMVVQRGFPKPPSLHEDRFRKGPVGHFFNVMSNGFGVMPSYRESIRTEDRWAIAAYIRALQLSQNATLADVPPAEQSKLQGAN